MGDLCVVKTTTMAKTVLITGASSGIGKAAADLFLEKGWNVIATMRKPVLTSSGQLLVLPMDVEEASSIKNAVKAGIDAFGRIDVLVNNAGYAVIGIFESSTEEQVRKQYAVNVFGLMNVTREVLPYLRANGEGVIVNISSYGGLAALPIATIYNSSKFAVEGFSEALAHELAHLNIAVKVVEPGSIATNFRSNADIIRNEIPDYEKLTSVFMQQHAKMTEGTKKATVQDVAAIIYGAATDGEKRIRYVAGEDAQFFIDQKFQASEAEYLQKMYDRIYR